MADFNQLPFFHQHSTNELVFEWYQNDYESKTISFYMCRGNRLHSLKCKRTTTKGG